MALLVAIFAQHGVLQSSTDRMVGYAEYCIGEVAIQVAINADGEPVAPHHHCPDCAPQVLTTAMEFDVWQRPIAVQSVDYASLDLQFDVQLPMHARYGRGPPVVL